MSYERGQPVRELTSRGSSSPSQPLLLNVPRPWPGCPCCCGGGGASASTSSRAPAAASAPPGPRHRSPPEEEEDGGRRVERRRTRVEGEETAAQPAADDRLAAGSISQPPLLNSQSHLVLAEGLVSALVPDDLRHRGRGGRWAQAKRQQPSAATMSLAQPGPRQASFLVTHPAAGGHGAGGKPVERPEGEPLEGRGHRGAVDEGRGVNQGRQHEHIAPQIGRAAQRRALEAVRRHRLAQRAQGEVGLGLGGLQTRGRGRGLGRGRTK